ncbi:hypothetical protein ACTTAI_00485 (plasmid) [Rhodobacter capsulatus]|uniref:hypothetical protein n=1 Tax=Rhodobacter capsulatus TaxID=1061 RepID=UPI004029D90E
MSHLSAPPPICETPPSCHRAQLGLFGTLRLLHHLALWHRRARARAWPGGPEALDDIGLSEADRRVECGRWFWQGRDR